MTKDRVVEILVYLMSEIQDNKQLSEIDLSALRERGYTASEISAAFSWIQENMQGVRGGRERSARAGKGSRRLLHDAEKLMFSMESQGYLILLAELGLLDDHDLEAVIDRAMVSGYEGLTVQEVRELVAAVLSSRPHPPGGQGHSMLNNEDSIH